MDRLQVDAIYTMCKQSGVPVLFLQITFLPLPWERQNAIWQFHFSNKHIYLLKRTFEHSRIFPFLQVISETLRVANLISGVFRRANTDIHFKGYFYRSYL